MIRLRLGLARTAGSFTSCVETHVEQGAAWNLLGCVLALWDRAGRIPRGIALISACPGLALRSDRRYTSEPGRYAAADRGISYMQTVARAPGSVQVCEGAASCTLAAAVGSHHALESVPCSRYVMPNGNQGLGRGSFGADRLYHDLCFRRCCNGAP
jgi:hypothetical protein